VLKVLFKRLEEGDILMIHRTHYGQDVIELVAKDQLRKKYGLKDGDFVRIKALVD
jgi:CTP-dependent riboflavin kinase